MRKISVYLTEEEVNKRIREMGREITEKFKGEAVYIVCILKGSVYFATELTKRIDLPMQIDFMKVSSYGEATKSSGVINIQQDISGSVEGKNVIIVEDIIDTGNTLHCLIELFKTRNPKTISICTLLDKPNRRQVEVDVNYVGFPIPDKFVVGYGLDIDEKYRNLPYIGFVED